VALLDCEQDALWHPEGTVWRHSLYVCDAAAAITARDGLAGEERAALLFAALCHDLGKPSTTSHDADGRIRSPGHDQAGIAPTEALLRRIGCPQDIISQVTPLVREHMAHIGMTVTDRAVRRLALRLAPTTIEQWGRLVEADHSGRPPLPPGNPGAEIVALAQQLGAAAGRPEPILLGRHLIDAGMLRPGPKLGALLRQAYQAQIDGAFATIGEGLEWAARSINHEEREE
jgi:tRNA nucleotidyltransferase (CCA-adding enzyme)